MNCVKKFMNQIVREEMCSLKRHSVMNIPLGKYFESKSNSSTHFLLEELFINNPYNMFFSAAKKNTKDAQTNLDFHWN